MLVPVPDTRFRLATYRVQPPGGEPGDPGEEPGDPGGEVGDPPGGDPPGGEPPGGGGCTGEPFSAGAVTVSPGKSVPLGFMVTFSWRVPADWNLDLSICCTSGGLEPCEQVPDPAQGNSSEREYEWCAYAAGTFEYLLAGTDGNGCRVETKGTVTVEPPDSIEPNPYSPTGIGPLYHAFQDWKVTAGGKPLGPCYDACVDEYVQFWNRKRKEWQDPVTPSGEMPFRWRAAGALDSCPTDNNPAFDYKPDRSLIFDAKRGSALPNKHPQDFAAGELIYRYRQKIGIALARCETCDPLPPDMFAQDDSCRWFSFGWYNFNFVKGVGDTVTHEGGTMSAD